MTRLVALALAGITACAAPMTVGPYVKSITRHGEALTVVSCQIILDGRDFYDGECSTQDIPLSRASNAPGAAALGPQLPPSTTNR